MTDTMTVTRADLDAMMAEQHARNISDDEALIARTLSMLARIDRERVERADADAAAAQEYRERVARILSVRHYSRKRADKIARTARKPGHVVRPGRKRSGHDVYIYRMADDVRSAMLAVSAERTDLRAPCSRIAYDVGADGISVRRIGFGWS